MATEFWYSRRPHCIRFVKSKGLSTAVGDQQLQARRYSQEEPAFYRRATKLLSSSRVVNAARNKDKQYNIGRGSLITVYLDGQEKTRLVVTGTTIIARKSRALKRVKELRIGEKPAWRSKLDYESSNQIAIHDM